MVSLYPYQSKIYRIKDFQGFTSLTVSVYYEPEYKGKVFYIELDNLENNLLLIMDLKKDALVMERNVLTSRLATASGSNAPLTIRLCSEEELEFELEIHCG